MASTQPAPPQAGTANPNEAAFPVERGAPEAVAGIDLESALQVPEPVVDEAMASLAEPAGMLAEPAGELTASVAHEAGSMEARFDRLLLTVHRNRPNDDLDLIRRAWAFCVQQHEGQKRAIGEPYIMHPLEVCQVLAELKMDSTAIAAGLLHDAVEDTDVTSPEIAKRFNEQVAHIVEGVTKLDKIKFANREDHQAENIRKMLLAMVTDVRVVIIKLADRLHNMRTLEHLKPEKQQKIARETLDIYAPLAHRLGMGKLRGELEDLAFRYTDPYAYEQVSRRWKRCAGRTRSFCDRCARWRRSWRAASAGRVESRIKRLYSIQQKLDGAEDSGGPGVRPARGAGDLRHGAGVLRRAGAAAYAVAAGAGAHQGLYCDAAAQPVPVAAHDADAPRGHQFEVQIRTEEMHRIAEEGIAAHWKYKAGDSVSAKDEQRLAWVRQLMEWQREMSDPNEFMSTLKIDLYPEEVYTFTPKGKVVVLPKDASPIDFAYAIHTEVGNTTMGAKVNGRIVPLRTGCATATLWRLRRRRAMRRAATGCRLRRAAARATRSSTG